MGLKQALTILAEVATVALIFGAAFLGFWLAAVYQ